MQITFVTRKFRNVERNLHCEVLRITPISRQTCSGLQWRFRNKGLFQVLERGLRGMNKEMRNRLSAAGSVDGWKSKV